MALKRAWCFRRSAPFENRGLLMSKTKAGVLSASAVPGLRRHALRSLLISVVYSLRHRGHQTGRFSASVSAVIRWSFFLQVGQVIHPSWLATSISFFTP